MREIWLWQRERECECECERAPDVPLRCCARTPGHAAIRNRYLLKLALVDRLPLTVTAQVVAVPTQTPDQPANVLPAGGVAVSVTTVPAATVAVQAVPQLMPPTLLVTVPELLTLTLSVLPLPVLPPPVPPPPEL